MALNIIGVTMMVKEARYYEDSKGTPWKTEFEAWKSDVALWLITSEALNEASANKLVEYIANGGQERACEFSQMIEAFGHTMPSRVSEAPRVIEDVPFYRIPRIDTSRVRCTGGNLCGHLVDECTADPDYQRWVKARRLYNENGGFGDVSLDQQPPSTIQHWLHKAEQAK